jgi:hypothetical protein
MITATTNGSKETVFHDAAVALPDMTVRNVVVASTTQMNLRCICKYINRATWHVHFAARNDFGPLRMLRSMSKVDTVPVVVDQQMHANKSINIFALIALLTSHVLLMVVMMPMMCLTFPTCAPTAKSRSSTGLNYFSIKTTNMGRSYSAFSTKNLDRSIILSTYDILSTIHFLRF